MEVDFLEDLSKRVALNSKSLPSICFYTLFHSHQRYSLSSLLLFFSFISSLMFPFLHSVNTIELSQDSSLVAAGLDDSSVRLWDLKRSSSSKNASGTLNNIINILMICFDILLFPSISLTVWYPFLFLSEFQILMAFHQRKIIQ